MTPIQATRFWLKNMVIGLNLCPFAKKPYQQDRIRYVLCTATDLTEVTRLFMEEIHFLEKHTSVETTLLILSEALQRFSSFWDYIGLTEDFLQQTGYEGTFQVASFHPKYQFAGTTPNDLQNYTNRAPFPIIHILRESSISRAVENFPDIDAIPQKNIATLQAMTLADILKRYTV